MKFPAASIIVAACAVTATSAFVVGGVHRALTSSAIRSQVGWSRSTNRCASTVRMTTASPMEFTKNEIASNDVIVFSKSYCPFCLRTKNTLADMDVDFKVIEMDEIENGDQIQAALLDISGQRTVPNVFVKGKHLGGNDDTQAAASSGKLTEMLK